MAYGDEVKPFDVGTRMLSNIAAQRTQASRDMPVAVAMAPIAAADTMATSLASILTAWQWHPESFVPGAAGGGGLTGKYHDVKYAAGAIGDTATMLMGAGALLKAGRAGGAIAGARAETMRGQGSQFQQYAREAAAIALPNYSRVEEIDNLVAAARRTNATAMGSMFGVNAPRVDMGQRAGTELQRAARLGGDATFRDVATAQSKDRLAQSVKEGLMAEVAMFSLYNNSDFLFPKDSGVASYLGFGLLGVGANVGIEHFLGRAVMKRAMADAAQAGAAAARDFRAPGRVTEGRAIGGVVGEDWQNGVAAVYGLDRAEGYERQIADIVRSSGNTLSPDAVRTQIEEVRQSMQTQLRESLSRAATFRTASELLRGEKLAGVKGVSIKDKTGLDKLVPAMAERARQNVHSLVGLAEIVDAEAPARMARQREVLRQRMDATMKDRATAAADGADAKKLAAFDAEEARLRAMGEELDLYRAGVVERGGAVNYNPWRQVPHWEAHPGGAPKLRAGEGYAPDAGSADVQNLRLLDNGELRLARRTAKHNVRLDKVADADLDFAQITALQSLVAGLTKQADTGPKWAQRFMDDFTANIDRKLEDLPFPLIDAIVEGRLQIPPAGQKAGWLKAQISSGNAQKVSLVKKLEWAKRHGRKEDIIVEELDAFDFEKALNLKLTDTTGRTNGLGHAVRAFMAQPGISASDLMTSQSGRVNDAYDNLLALAQGWAGAGTSLEREFISETFWKGLNGAENLLRVDEPGGIGAIYHNFNVPTDTEMQVAKLLDMRNGMRQQALFESKNPLIANVAQSTLIDDVAYRGSREVASIYSDHTVKNNVVIQTTQAHRHQKALQHASTVGRNAQHSIDQAKVAILQPIGEKIKALVGRGSGLAVQAEVSNARHLVSRSLAILDESWAPGLNMLDMNRPGQRKMLENIFGELEGMPKAGSNEPTYMFDVNIAKMEGRYVPVELSAEAADLLNDFTRVSYDLLDAINTLRSSAGLPRINKLNGHMQVSDFSRYKLRFIRSNDDGKTIGYIKARTDQEADRLVAQALEDMGARNPRAGGYSTISLTEIQQYKDAVDQAFVSRLTDFSGIKQTGQTKGGAQDFRLDVSGDTLEEMMIAMRNAFDDVKDRTVAAVYADSIAEASQIRKRLGYDPTGKGETYYDPVAQWQNLLLRRNNRPKDSWVSKGHDWVEGMANAAVGKVSDTFGRPYELWHAALNRSLDKSVMQRMTPAEQKVVEQLDKDYTPWTGLLNNPDLRKALKIRKEDDPFKLARQLQMANRRTGQIFLQFWNLAHPILNVTGAVATMPSVVRAVQMRDGESVKDWKARVGHIADYFDAEAGVATVSPAKLMNEGMHLMFNDPDAYAQAMRMGYLEANLIEELNKVVVVHGDKFTDQIDNFMRVTDVLNTWMINPAMRRAGIEPSANTISERSETWTRAWAHMSGLALARRSGSMTEAQAHSFAHWFSNQNIADFTPQIRGEAFQGLAGIPFGLFQSYGINIMQRLFRYAENKDTRALLTAGFMQGAMFGTQSLPGWPLMNDMYFNNPDVKADERGATSLNERVHAAFGKEIGDVLMTGGLSSMGYLLGGETGINLYTSGDINPRLPTIPPSVSLAAQIVQGATKSAKVLAQEVPKSFTSGVDADYRRLGDVMANYFPARGVRGMIDLAMGERVDRNNNLVNENVWTPAGVVSRLLGTRTTNEMQMSAAIWENSQANSQRTQKMGEVRNQLLRALRDGELSEEEAAFYLARYITAGGREDQWQRWLDFSKDKAVSPRDQRALDKLVQNTGEVLSHNLAGVGRLAAAGSDLQKLIAPLEEPPAE